MLPLQIVIPSYRRMLRQSTLGYLPPDWCPRTTLVVDQHDYDLRNLYAMRGAQMLVHPPEIDTIAKKRAWIIMQPQFQKIVMFDDDLRFSVRDPETGIKLRQARPEDVSDRLIKLEADLEVYVHAGWSARQGNNNNRESSALNSRMCFVLGYRCEWIREAIEAGFVKLGRVRTREDMELTLQLLKMGKANHVDFTVTADQVSGYGAAGGCSDERTVESSNEDAELLALLHPGLVAVKYKSYEGSINRKEVVVQWKKSFKMSQS